MTYEIIPSSIKIAFVKAQKVSIQLKHEHSLVIIRKFWDNWSYPNSITFFLTSLADMMAKLSLNWEFKHDHQYADYIANNLITVFSLEDCFKLIYQPNNDNQKIHCTALGILWNRCLHDLTNLLFKKWNKAKEFVPSEDICSSSVKQIFSRLTEKNLNQIELEIKGTTIKRLLKKELES